RAIALAIMAVAVGAFAGSLLAPRPTGAVSKELVQLQEDVTQLLQGQQSLRSTIDSNNASMRTLIQQSLDSVSAMNVQMSNLQKSVGEATANDSSKIDGMATQTQGVSDNLQDVQARVGKLATQMNDLQGTLQSIDGRLAGGPRTKLELELAFRPGAGVEFPGVAIAFRNAGNRFGHAVSKCVARFHHRQVRPRTSGIFGLREELWIDGSGLQRAVLSGGNFVCAGRVPGCSDAIQYGAQQLSAELQTGGVAAEEGLGGIGTGHE